MALSIKQMSFVAVALGLFAGCSAAPPDAPTDAETMPSDTVTNDAPKGDSTSSASADESDRLLAQKINDPAFRGMIDLGAQAGWSVYFDREHELVVASRDDSTLAFNPHELDEAKIEALVEAGLPRTVVMSWKGKLCRAACWTLAGVGCGAVSVACGVGTVFTVGGFAIPCGVAIVTACGAAGGGASLCGDWCTDKYG